MRVIPRFDVSGAYTVESGKERYAVYLGLDDSFPRCDCPSMTYRNLRDCKHTRLCLAHPNGTDE